MTIGGKVKPKNPKAFLEYSGFYGEKLPAYFIFKDELKNLKGGVSILLDNPDIEPSGLMKYQWFNSTHLKETK